MSQHTIDAARKIDAGKTMAEMWSGFAEALIPFAPVTSSQFQEMQKAFYAGGLCLFNWFMVQMDPEREPTDADMRRVDAIEQELRDFLTAVGGERIVQ